MSRLFLVLTLWAAASQAVAFPCHVAPSIRPCDPGTRGAREKKKILDLIRRAQGAESDVKKLETGYLAVRENPNISPEKKLAALAPYRAAKGKQEQLSRPAADGSGIRRSWASVEEDERDAYKAVFDEADTFGLDAEDKKFLDERWFRHHTFAKIGFLTRRTVDTRKEALRKEFYENVQVNIEEEYEGLQRAVRDSRLKLDERQRLDREERERREREALTRIGTLAEWVAAAAQCGYRLDLRSHAPSTVFGFRNSEHRHSLKMGLNTPSLRGLKIILLISRTCDEVRRQPAPAEVGACNDAVSSLSAPMSSEVYGHLTYANSGWNEPCVEALLADAPTIKDAKSFGKSVAAYLKRLKKKRADDAKKDRKERGRTSPPSGEGRNRSDDNRTPRESPDHDEVWRRIKPIIP